MEIARTFTLVTTWKQNSAITTWVENLSINANHSSLMWWKWSCTMNTQSCIKYTTQIWTKPSMPELYVCLLHCCCSRPHHFTYSFSPPELKLHLLLRRLKSHFHSLINLLLFLCVRRDLICIQNLNVVCVVCVAQAAESKTGFSHAGVELDVHPSIHQSWRWLMN